MKTTALIILTSIFLFSFKKDSENMTAIPDFINIVDARTEIHHNKIISKITLKRIPKQLVFDNNDLKENALEYEWSVNLDLENDGKIDYKFSIFNFKSPYETQQTGDIIGNTQQDIWAINNDKGFSYLAPLRAKIIGNVIIFKIPLNKSSELKNIIQESTISYKTLYNDGHNVYSDEFLE